MYSLSPKDKIVLGSEQKFLILKKQTGIADRNILLPLWQILFLEHGRIPLSYFRLSFRFIKKNSDGDLAVEVNWVFWVDWIFIRFFSALFILQTLQIVLLIFFAAENTSNLTILLSSILAFFCFFTAIKIWLSSLRRGRLKETQALLLRHTRAHDSL